MPTSSAIMTFQSTPSDDPAATCVALRRPLALVATILMVHAAPPLAVFALAALIFGTGSPTAVGMLLGYTVPTGASSVMWIGMFCGELALGLGLAIAATFATTATSRITDTASFFRAGLYGRSLPLSHLSARNDTSIPQR